MPQSERDLDGPASEFPHRAEAMRNIRALWGGWLVARDPLDRDILAYAIDEERLLVSRGPGPLWERFADTLPGYRDYQGRMVATMFGDLFQSE